MMISLSEMQNLEFEIMKAIHEFCCENAIRYSLAYGTLLGAVRHHGFIPWDDDMDIIMPRPDYDKFITSFTSSRYKVVSLSDEGYLYPYAKVYDCTTFLHEELRFTYQNMGVFVDIFPVDGLPASEYMQKRLYSRQVLLYKLHMSMKYHYSNEWTLVKNMQLLLGRIIGTLIPIKRILTILEKQSMQYSFDASETVAVLVGEDVLIPIKKQEFDQLKLIQFGNTQFYSIPEFDELLHGLYGNYLELPPKEKQKSEHRYDVGWKL